MEFGVWSLGFGGWGLFGVWGCWGWDWEAEGPAPFRLQRRARPLISC